MPLLSTPRLSLRALEPEDLDLLWNVENDTSLWSCGVTNVPYSRYVLKRYLTETRYDLYADGQLRLVMETCGSKPVPVGLVDLVDFEPRHLRAEVGVAVLPQYRRKGLGREALMLLSRYSREQFGMHRLYAVVSASNLPALALFRSAGFDDAARLPQWLKQGEGYADAQLLDKILCESH